MELDNLNKI